MNNGIPPDIENRIRAAGPVIDVAAARSMYEDLLAAQDRGAVVMSRDVAYGPDVRHRLDIYQPASSQTASPPPVALFFHGGGFIRGDKSERSHWGVYLARRGILTLCANYRLAPQNRWPAGAQDVAGAYAWARRHASEWGGDPTRIFLVGESAGAAHTAAATLIRHDTWHLPAPPTGVVLVSGVYNARLEALARQQFGIATPDVRNEAYFGTDTERYAGMSTVELIDSPPFPLLLTYAELDPAQMQVQAGELFARLVAHHGFSPQLKVIRGHNHLSQCYSVNTGDDSLGDPIAQFILH